MTSSPCATLMTLVTPQTSAMPYATSAKIAPTSTPSTASCKARAGVSNRSARFDISGPSMRASPLALARARRRRHALIPGRCRVDDLRLGPLGRRHHLVIPVLHLVENHRLGDVLAGAVELDRPVEGREVGPGQRVAHFLRIERARALDRVGEGEHRGARLR